MITRPMLAADLVETIKDPITGSKRDILHLEWIRYPVLATPKIDGIRCVCQGGQVLSRTFKPIPNNHIRYKLQHIFKDKEDQVFDGELVTFSDGKPDAYNTVQSKVMTTAGSPTFSYLIFDRIIGSLNIPYATRAKDITYWDYENLQPISCLLPTELTCEEDLLAYEEKCLDLGYEGICFRSPSSPYKQGRSTVREGYLIKLKRYETGKAEVLDYYELLHNSNQAETDNFGLTKRSSCAVGMVSSGCLGGLNARDLVSGITFDVGSGFSQREREELYKLGGGLKGKHFLYKFFPQGIKEAPRHPIFMEWLS
jgi:DNA ligase-1